MAIRCVLFDFGDTLFHCPDGADVLVRHGMEPGEARALWDELWESSKSAVRLARGRDLNPAVHRREWLDILAPADQRIPGVTTTLYDECVETANWLPYSDAAGVLRTLRDRGVRIGVVSNIPVPLRPLFALHGLDDAVELYAESHAHGVTKPDPFLVTHACAELAVAPAETLLVGDSAVADGAAVHSGLIVLLLPHVPRGHPRGLGHVLALAGSPMAGDPDPNR